MALNDILKNSKYPDDMVLNLPDGSTVNVGEIRALPAAERQALTSQIEQRQNILGQAELAFAAKFQQAVQEGWLAQDGRIVPPPARQQQTQSQQPSTPTAAELRAAAQAEFNLDDNDPLLGPVVKAMKKELAARDTRLAELSTKIDALPSQFDSLKTTLTDSLGKVTGVVNTSVGRYLNDQYQSQFAEATKSLPKGVTVDYETAYKYASERQLKDKDGFLQVSEAVDRLTWNDRKKAEQAEWRESEKTRLAKEMEQNNKLASLTPPSSRNPLHSSAKVADGQFDPFNERTDAKGNKVKVVKSFEEAMSAAMSDEDVLKSAMQTATFGTVQ
jgi:hypothetical protein